MTYQPSGCVSLREAFQDFENSDAYWRYPLSVRSRFQQVVRWWPPRDAELPLTQVNAAFAKRQRDRAAFAQGWRAGNHTLILLQALVAKAVEAGVLPVNRIRQVGKLSPPRQHPTSYRRPIKPVRDRNPASTDSSKSGKSTGEYR
jgi:hypothetical protein